MFYVFHLIFHKDVDIWKLRPTTNLYSNVSLLEWQHYFLPFLSNRTLIRTWLVSIVNIVYPDLFNNEPISCAVISGDMCNPKPPSRSISAICNEHLSSNNVCPPNIDPMNIPSCLSE
ncbi:hypothetical protein DERF_006797 [Dermatophagoides farinae]|uniref:Uncharacterized protein n=1 Tax=Dermatophagoides farinae TaxID=6954 RepID=A0A922HXU7_DERFA|nr:hypothetical protein DERF_006797 [Dermatophagoides farinae]